MSELVALIWGREMGRVQRDRRGRLSFTYSEAWREDNYSHPLSLSMPLAAATHPQKAIETFLWGLLPDNESILQKWAQKFQVSARSAFGLISNVGEDCAGAVQFVRPERVGEFTPEGPPIIQWLSDEEIAQRLKDLRADQAAWRAPGDTGQFSLAGAQAKTALYRSENRWGVPSGRTPTSHILKPPTPQFDGHVENEYFCMKLAFALRLTTALCSIERFQDEIAICVERYDRDWTPNELIRIHQEDMCQALSVHPSLKYENDGGPGAVQIVELLRAHSSARDVDISRFLSALIFNWLIAGTDAHAKNFSVLIGLHSTVRLAPLYDLGSALPYDLDQQKMRLAMRVGDKYRLRDIGARDWWRLADALRIDRDVVTTRVKELAAQIPDEANDLHARMFQEGLIHPTVDRLRDRLIERVAQCVRAFDLAQA
jgi:serine/threonine-protein kinase HipA